MTGTSGNEGSTKASALVDPASDDLKQQWKAYAERVSSYAIRELPALDKLVIWAFKWVYNKVKGGR